MSKESRGHALRLFQFVSTLDNTAIEPPLPPISVQKIPIREDLEEVHQIGIAIRVA